MSQWQDQIRSHPLWQHLRELGPAIDQAVSREDIGSVGVDLIERVRTVHVYTGKRLAALDPALVYSPALDGIASSLQHAVSEFQAFASDGQQGHLESANSQASTILLHLASLVAPTVPDDLTSLSEAAAGYRSAMVKYVDTAGRSIARVEAEMTNLGTRVEELVGEVSAERSRLTSLASEFQSQFSNAQDSRAAEFSETQTSRLKEATDAQSVRQTRFDELLTSYSQRLNDQDAETARQLDGIRKATFERLSALELEHKASVKELDERYQASAKATVEAIEQHKSDVEKLVGVIGDLGVTSGYQKAAESAKKSMWLWQGLTVLGFAIVIGFAFWAFLPAMQGGFSWDKFAGRVVLTIAVGVFAAYSATQADRYMEAERRNRKLALELEALGPYLAPLPEDKQQEFRLAMGDRTFGREEQGFNRRDRSPATPLDIVVKNKGLQSFLVELVKAARHG